MLCVYSTIRICRDIYIIGYPYSAIGTIAICVSFLSLYLCLYPCPDQFLNGAVNTFVLHGNNLVDSQGPYELVQKLFRDSHERGWV